MPHPAPQRVGGGSGAPEKDEEKKELHVAPMLDYSKREFRALFSVLSRCAVLWTDMVVDDTVAHSSKLDDHLGTDGGKFSNKLVCQIGGNDSTMCGAAAREIFSGSYGYGEVNLNVDCPSDKVSGRREFGAALMRRPDACVAVLRAMTEAASFTGSSSPTVSIKCRVGVDELDTLEYASDFVSRLRIEAGCTRFVLHARKCVLGGMMSARQNRSVPPLNYPRVYELCRRHPDCEFWISGGIGGLREAREICYGRAKGESGALFPEFDGEEADGDVQGAANEEDDDGRSAEGKKDNGCHEARRHSVPCSICDHPNGSCTSPLPCGSVPPNLRGAMLGRAAIYNPSLFWDVDRYFYGCPTNPCRNRREVLGKYAAYLESLYPRRCCDESDEVTWKVPAPMVRRVREYCSICAEFYRAAEDSDGTEGKSLSLSAAPPLQGVRPQKVKIAPRIVGRSLKPVRGLFFGLPGAKAFVRELDRLGMDAVVRNCGPAYILLRAMKVVAPEVLDADFIRTEDLPARSRRSDLGRVVGGC